MTGMHHKLVGVHSQIFTWQHLWSEALLALVLAFLVLAAPASAADLRFEDRSLYIRDVTPSATTDYTVAWTYMSPEAVGSVEMLFCIDPIPYHACVTPPGLNASNVNLTEQLGETGFTIQSKTTNRIVLTRVPTMINGFGASYKFDGMVNPSNTNQSFSIRLKSFASTDASGPQIDFGSVKGQVTDAIVIETQVPPMLIFCVAQEVLDNCAGTNDTFFTDMGSLDNQNTLNAQSQMAVGTNASGGFVITANGATMSAGVNTITPNSSPKTSIPGSNQFGINLVENDEPSVGNDPEGIWANAVASPDYSIPNQYKFVSGDVVAYSPNVSLMKKFTVSYVVNSSPMLRAGVYTTTITYIASGQF